MCFFPIFLKHNGWQRRNVVQQEPGLWTKIKLPPGAGAEITICGSGFSSSSSTFLLTTDLKKFPRKKSWLLKKCLKIGSILILLSSQKGNLQGKLSYKANRSWGRS
jgi:hypothetical protein